MILRKLFLNVRLLKAKVALAVKDLEVKGDQKGGHTESSEDDERNRVVVRDELGAGGLGGDDGWIVGVDARQNTSDKLRNEAEADVLNPEDKAVGRAENLLVDDLRNRWP